MKKNKTIKIIISILVLLGAIIVGGLIYVDGLMNNINHTDFSNEVIYEDEDLEIQQEKIIDENLFNSIKFVKEEDIQYSDVEEVSFDKDIINILMLGVEAQGGGNGRTDTIMIGTIDTKNKELKITSIMRDIYVKIPGHSNNKINAAYSYGGVELTKETIKENFGDRKSVV